MRDTDLFQLAMGLTSPWKVMRSEFSVEDGRLDPHESPHFEATRKSLIFGFPRRLDGESADWGSDASTEGAI